MNLRALPVLVARHLTYANVAATLAVVLALTGTAYAAGLSKNSVGSKHIKNGSVQGRDVRNDSLTGADVAEGTLGTVPDAAKLGGLAPSAYQQKALTAKGDFTSTLELAVPGYGTFRLHCEVGTPAPDDDAVRFGWNMAALGAGSTALVSGIYTPGDGLVGFTQVDSWDDPDHVLVAEGDHVHIDALFQAADGARVVQVTAVGIGDSPADSCAGLLTAQVLK